MFAILDLLCWRYSSSLFYRKRYLGAFFILLIAGIIQSANAQSSAALYRVDYYLGIKGVYNIGVKGESSATFSVSGGAGVYRDKMPLSFMFQTAFNMYAKGIGTNKIDNYTRLDADRRSIQERRRWEIDFVNSLIGNLHWGNRRSDAYAYNMSVQPFNQMTATALYMHHDYHLTFGSNFVFNNHQRNQQVGYLGLHFPAVSINYFNDGVIGLLGDSYDRYWTGGGSVIIRNTDPARGLIWRYSRLEMGFERFTDDVQDAYQLSNALLLPFVKDRDFYKLLYNNSITYVKAAFQDFSLGYTLMGAYKFDVQDIIHLYLVGNPRHKTHFPIYHQLQLGYYPRFHLK